MRMGPSEETVTFVMARNLAEGIAGAQSEPWYRPWYLSEETRLTEVETPSRLSLLLDASERLASSIDYETTLTNIAQVAVPELADWAALDLFQDDRTVRRVAVCHVDPAKVALAQELFARYPPRLDRIEYGLGRLLHTGQPDYRPVIEDAALVLAAQDEDHLVILRALGLRSGVIAPIHVRGRVAGALTLVHAESARTYSPDDVRVALDLARRAGMALENALLHREAIEARRQVEESRRMLERIAEATPGLLFVYDVVERRNVYINDAARSMMGYTPDDLRALAAAIEKETLHPDDRPGIEASLAQLSTLPDGRTLEVEHRIRHRDGRWRNLRSRFGVFSRDETGHPREIVGISLDVTDERARDAALRESERRLSTLLSNLPGMAYRCSLAPPWRFELASEGALMVTGHPASDFLEGRIDGLTIVHPDDRAWVAEAVATAVERHEPYSLVWRTFASPDEERWVLERGRAVYDDAGQPVALEGFLSDLTDVKRYERALEEADRRKDEFLAVLGHELRNPLTPIRNAAELLRLIGPAEGPIAKASDILERQVRHMARILDDLLDVSRITRGKIVLRREARDLVALVRSAVSDLGEVGVSLDIQVPHDALVAEVDEVRFVQVIGNLLHNALKFTAPPGRILVRLEATADEAVLTVSDEGDGMDPSDLARIFEPFTQLRSRQDRAGGLGLGLALVKGIVELHDGRVTAVSEGRGRGSSFEVRLPRSSGSVTPVGAAPTPKADLYAARVLVIEDNEDAATTMCMLLEHLGCVVARAGSAAEGLRTFREFGPALVLCDVDLAEGPDGYEVARTLRREGTGNVLLVAITGYGQEGDRMRALEAGFDRHLTKPADLANIREVLAELATRNPRA